MNRRKYRLVEDRSSVDSSEDSWSSFNSSEEDSNSAHSIPDENQSCADSTSCIPSTYSSTSALESSPTSTRRLSGSSIGTVHFAQVRSISKYSTDSTSSKTSSESSSERELSDLPRSTIPGKSFISGCYSRKKRIPVESQSSSDRTVSSAHESSTEDESSVNESSTGTTSRSSTEFTLTDYPTSSCHSKKLSVADPLRAKLHPRKATLLSSDSDDVPISSSETELQGRPSKHRGLSPQNSRSTHTLDGKFVIHSDDGDISDFRSEQSDSFSRQISNSSTQAFEQFISDVDTQPFSDITEKPNQQPISRQPSSGKRPYSSVNDPLLQSPDRSLEIDFPNENAGREFDDLDNLGADRVCENDFNPAESPFKLNSDTEENAAESSTTLNQSETTSQPKRRSCFQPSTFTAGEFEGILVRSSIMVSSENEDFSTETSNNLEARRRSNSQSRHHFGYTEHSMPNSGHSVSSNTSNRGRMMNSNDGERFSRERSLSRNPCVSFADEGVIEESLTEDEGINVDKSCFEIPFKPGSPTRNPRLDVSSGNNQNPGHQSRHLSGSSKSHKFDSSCLGRKGSSSECKKWSQSRNPCVSLADEDIEDALIENENIKENDNVDYFMSGNISPITHSSPIAVQDFEMPMEDNYSPLSHSSEIEVLRDQSVPYHGSMFSPINDESENIQDIEGNTSEVKSALSFRPCRWSPSILSISSPTRSWYGDEPFPPHFPGFSSPSPNSPRSYELPEEHENIFQEQSLPEHSFASEFRRSPSRSSSSFDEVAHFQISPEAVSKDDEEITNEERDDEQQSQSRNVNENFIEQRQHSDLQRNTPLMKLLQYFDEEIPLQKYSEVGSSEYKLIDEVQDPPNEQVWGSVMTSEQLPSTLQSSPSFDERILFKESSEDSPSNNIFHGKDTYEHPLSNRQSVKSLLNQHISPPSTVKILSNRMSSTCGADLSNNYSSDNESTKESRNRKQPRTSEDQQQDVVNTPSRTSNSSKLYSFKKQPAKMSLNSSSFPKSSNGQRITNPNRLLLPEQQSPKLSSSCVSPNADNQQSTTKSSSTTFSEQSSDPPSQSSSNEEVKKKLGPSRLLKEKSRRNYPKKMCSSRKTSQTSYNSTPRHPNVWQSKKQNSNQKSKLVDLNSQNRNYRDSEKQVSPILSEESSIEDQQSRLESIYSSSNSEKSLANQQSYLKNNQTGIFTDTSSDDKPMNAVHVLNYKPRLSCKKPKHISKRKPIISLTGTNAATKPALKRKTAKLSKKLTSKTQRRSSFDILAPIPSTSLEQSSLSVVHSKALSRETFKHSTPAVKTHTSRFSMLKQKISLSRHNKVITSVVTRTMAMKQQTVSATFSQQSETTVVCQQSAFTDVNQQLQSIATNQPLVSVGTIAAKQQIVSAVFHQHSETTVECHQSTSMDVNQQLESNTTNQPLVSTPAYESIASTSAQNPLYLI